MILAEPDDAESPIADRDAAPRGTPVPRKSQSVVGVMRAYFRRES